jgi:hypothetical protein
MSHAPNCPHCKSLENPIEMLDRLQFCFEAVGDLFSVANQNAIGMVDAGNVASLLGLLSELQVSALSANAKTFRQLEQENSALRDAIAADRLKDGQP